MSVRSFIQTYGLILLFCLVVYGAHSYDSDLRKDNVVYAAISKDLLTRDNPMILSQGGEVYLNKPPLFFWMTAASMKVLGPSVFSAKLMTILFGCANAMLVFLLTRRLTRNESVAYLSVLFVAFTYGIMRCTNACRMENLLTFFLFLTLHAFLAYRENRSVRWMLLAGLWMGLGALTKGPAAALPLVVVVVYVLLFERELISLRFLRDLAGSLVVAALVCGWWYAYIVQHTAFAETFVQGQVLDRVAQDEVYPSDPLYAYLLMFLKSYVLFLPFVVIGVRRLWQERVARPSLLLLGTFSVLLLVAIHLLATKYDRYLLPLYFLLAVPAAVGAPRYLREHGRPILLVLALVFGFAVSCFPIPFLHRHDFARLERVNAMAQRSGLPVVLDPVFNSWWEQRAAALFFLDEFHLAPPPAGAYFEVCRHSDDSPDPVLLETRYFHLYLRRAAASR